MYPSRFPSPPWFSFTRSVSRIFNQNQELGPSRLLTFYHKTKPNTPSTFVTLSPRTRKSTKEGVAQSNAPPSQGRPHLAGHTRKSEDSHRKHLQREEGGLPYARSTETSIWADDGEDDRGNKAKAPTHDLQPGSTVNTSHSIPPRSYGIPTAAFNDYQLAPLNCNTLLTHHLPANSNFATGQMFPQMPVPSFGPFPVNSLPSLPSLQMDQLISSPQRDQEKVIFKAAPKPTAKYLARATSVASKCDPQPLLVILDMNGTLGKKTKKGGFIMREGLTKFLQKLTRKYYVMIWTSATPQIMYRALNLISEKNRAGIIAAWGRDTLGLSKLEYQSNAQVYKRLEVVWSDKTIQAFHPNSKTENGKVVSRWDQSNTVLIDDSTIKGCAQPYNIFEIPEFTSLHADKPGVFDNVFHSLDYLSRHDDVSKVLHKWAVGAIVDDEESDFIARQRAQAVQKRADATDVTKSAARESKNLRKKGRRETKDAADALAEATSTTQDPPLSVADSVASANSLLDRVEEGLGFKKRQRDE
ncbi:hypothetical protein N7495_003046 [Penicillium taxi]|uniref:uncharacterized protein n=1 Tax=Penicillium taxi TaxID=168475 RepID=UPI00254529EF|nr:uncharacterized protein N7495_003046 [Penicillium taxi]KAJ5902518.1 hypothetical protein N7495_003046 [Penicillium taxi]